MRLIDADALMYAVDGNPLTTDSLKEYVRSTVKAQPTIDAVPVIRCRDCKFLRFTGTVWKCQNRLVIMLCEPNDYCSRGERKEE